MNAEPEPEGPEPEGPEPEDEWELSVLLERVVPQNPAPHDRIAQIRRRVRRRRRRRVAAGALAALGGVTAAAVAAAALLQPAGPVTPRGQDVLPAAPPTRGAPAPGSPSPVPSPTEPAYVLVSVDALSGLVLKLPGPYWRSLVTADPDGLVVGFAGSQPLHERSGCAKQEVITYTVCPPVDELAEGGTLISFRQVEKRAGKGIKPGRFVVKGVTAAGEGCRALGGRQELSAWAEDPDATSSVGLVVSACFRRPAKGAVEGVVEGLRNAAYR